MDITLNMQDYWQMLPNYADTLRIVLSAIITAIVVFFITLLLFIFFRKIILVKRKNLFLKYLAISYMIVIPLVAGFFGFKFGLINGLDNNLKKNLPSYTKNIEKTFINKFGADMSTILFSKFPNSKEANIKISTNEAIDMLSLAIYTQYGQSLEQSSKQQGIRSKAAELILQIARGKMVSSKIKKGIHGLLVDKIGTSEEVSKEIMDTKIGELVKEGLFTKILTLQVNNFSEV